MITLMPEKDLANLLAAAYDRDSELAEWLVQWLDGYGHAKAYQDRYEGWCLVVSDTWYANDGNAEIACGHDGRSARREFVDSGDWGDWGDVKSTEWIYVTSYRKAISYRGDLVNIDCQSECCMVVDADPLMLFWAAFEVPPVKL